MGGNVSLELLPPGSDPQELEKVEKRLKSASLQLGTVEELETSIQESQAYTKEENFKRVIGRNPLERGINGQVVNVFDCFSCYIGNVEFLVLRTCTALCALQSAVTLIANVWHHIISTIGTHVLHMSPKSVSDYEENGRNWILDTQRRIASMCIFASFLIFFVTQVVMRRPAIKMVLNALPEGAAKSESSEEEERSPSTVFASLRWLLLAPAQLHFLIFGNQVANSVAGWYFSGTKHTPWTFTSSTGEPHETWFFFHTEERPQVFLFHACLLIAECSYVVWYTYNMWKKELEMDFLEEVGRRITNKSRTTSAFAATPLLG